MKKPRRAAIYTRISNDPEGRTLGVARQEKDGRAMAQREGLTVVEVYSDNDISASTISRKKRPDWERMLDDAEAGRFDVIIAYSSSRLTRRPGEREDLIDLYDERGIAPWFVNSGKPDLATSAGRTAFRLLGTLDTAEPERTSELVRRKQQELAEAGRYNGPRPFGWDIHGKGADQRLTINETEAAVIRECVRRVLALEALWSITNDLNARGITTSTGGSWATQTLRRMLLRWTNCGYRKHQPLKRGKPYGAPQIYPGQWEAIIDRETHERVVALLTDPRRRSNNRGTAVKYLLTSIAKCGECGGPLVGATEFTYMVKGYRRKDGTRSPDRPRTYPRSYKCANAGCHGVQRRMADVDAWVEGIVVGLLERDGVRVLGGDPKAAAEARDRAAALQAKLDLAADQWSDDQITDDEWARIKARLRPRLDAEQARLRAALPATDLAEFAGAGAAEAWEAADVERRRMVLRTLAEAIDLTMTVEAIGSGNGGTFDPASVRIDWTKVDSGSAA